MNKQLNYKFQFIKQTEDNNGIMFMDWITYEHNGKVANTKFIVHLIDQLSSKQGGIWIWTDYNIPYFIFKGKIYATTKHIDHLKSMTIDFPSSKLQTIKLSDDILANYLKMAHRRIKRNCSFFLDEDDYIVDNKVFIFELNCCKDMGNSFFNLKLYGLALLCYTIFFLKPNEAVSNNKEVNASNAINNNKQALKEANKINVAKLCNNVSACLFYQKQYQQSITWCQHALYFNKEYKKVKKRIKRIDDLLINGTK